MPGGLWRVPSFTLAVFPFLISTIASPARRSIRHSTAGARCPLTLPSARPPRCLLISVKMFSLHSQVKLKFSPSFAVHPCAPKFFQTLFKIRISISPRRAAFLPSNPPASPRPMARSFLNELISLGNHARFLYIHAPRRFNRVCKYDV